MYNKLVEVVDESVRRLSSFYLETLTD